MLPRRAFACLLFACSVAIAPVWAQAAPDAMQLSAMETKFFAHSYDKDAEGDRLARIEQTVFGSAQLGATAQRLERLKNAIKPQESYDIKQPIVATEQTVRKAPSNQPAAVHDSSNYPRVAELEQTILGHTYLGDSVQDRLSRLENKAFGKASAAQPDLAARVDSLNEYAVVFAMPNGGGQNQNFGGLRGSTNLAYRAPNRFFGVVDQIESLEGSVFGSKSTNKPLLQRVGTLEQSVYGAPRDQDREDLTTRVSHLWASVNPTAMPLQTAQGFDTTQNQDWSAQQNQLAQLQQQRASMMPTAGASPRPVASSSHSVTATSSRHSFLKKIGKVVAVAGNLAITVASSAASGPYYNGYATGYGGYGGGAGGYTGGPYTASVGMPNYGGAYGMPGSYLNVFH